MNWTRPRISIACALALSLFVVSTLPAGAERLVSSLSSHIVQITSSFTGVELVLFGTVENDQAMAPRTSGYDIVATVTGPHQSVVTRRKERMFGIWINAESRSFAEVPSYLEVLATRPFESITNADTLRRQQIGIANTVLPEQIEPDSTDVIPNDQFRDAFVRIKRERNLYGEITNGVTFLTPTLYRASIFVPAEAAVGNYEVDVKLFADGAVIARTNSAFEIVTVGFERFIANAAVDHGLAYGVAAAMMAVLTGWFASIIFRRD
ncbi:MAG TPA: TIGR02186 family protein [Xanthobacteraceae bacterium]|nr:TIGR02186 family protein [Xanthobacteraceae bacterium]